MMKYCPRCDDSTIDTSQRAAFHYCNVCNLMRKRAGDLYSIQTKKYKIDWHLDWQTGKKIMTLVWDMHTPLATIKPSLDVDLPYDITEERINRLIFLK